MTAWRQLRCDPQAFDQAAERLTLELAAGGWLQLLGPRASAGDPELVPRSVDLPPGPGLVLASGGSSGGRQHCLQPIAHCDRSAAATGRWLETLGLTPSEVQIWNPLPLQHVSGLMPWWRAQQWGAGHGWLPPALMKQPRALLEWCHQQRRWRDGPMLLSLVPTQLARLLKDPAGIEWLRAMTVIWVGGAALPDDLAQRARQARLPLSPCYGATETAAMVAAQTPAAFLRGDDGCGAPLDDVELRVDAQGGLAVRCPRLALARCQADGSLEPLADGGGWWRSGDLATPRELEGRVSWRILGRLDGAIHSGGVTVFPEQLELRLMASVRANQLPVQALLLLGVRDPEWGERLVALVRWSPGSGDSGDGAMERMRALQALVADWLPAERPIAWHGCPDLAPTAAGKWQRSRWQAWLQSLEAEQPRACDDQPVRDGNQQ
ncbi:O-succinylbenzoic acid--CoA ligase [Synechococcus sp. WH 8101]|uniref:AMP-binding protein n=1 Tax=Synechococcus sp. WH 8101 TaxID=59932 RepID=UPI0010239478|nr:AMP-binding protein [Synechococcus sp. WH 8101]QBE70210.1 O-succinylbenzoic acid--CoA ligase [Synechococcus sp. WH 8101]QNI46481.1 O-succinylbenzoic acid--CoA ligase (OSB-CoA synthetase) [Synechococcus sp. WH 8101]